MSAVIAPAVLAATPEEYQQQMERIAGFAERVHLDITDGEFAPQQTVGLTDLWAPEGMAIDIHLMAHDVMAYVPQLIQLRPQLIILHAEATGDVQAGLTQIRQAGIKAGLALLRATVPRTVEALIQQADHVMIFSGELGKFGGQASLMQLEKIRLIRAINQRAEIGWDGGATVENAYSLVRGGVNVLNVGGAIQRATDPEAVYRQLQAEIAKQGVLG